MDFYRRCYGTDGYLTDFPGLTKESATWLGRPKQEGRASAVHAKARVIEETLGTRPLDLWHTPRDLQEIAFAKGLIPYIPADRKD
jgi:hypothetical protein